MVSQIVQEADDPISKAICRLPEVIQEDVERLLVLRNDALAKAHEPEIFNEDEAVSAMMAIIKAYNAALHSISLSMDEPVLDLGTDDDEDETESFDGSLNVDAGSPACAFPPFLQAQLDRRAELRAARKAAELA